MRCVAVWCGVVAVREDSAVAMLRGSHPRCTLRHDYSECNLLLNGATPKFARTLCEAYAPSFSKLTAIFHAASFFM